MGTPKGKPGAAASSPADGADSDHAPDLPSTLRGSTPQPNPEKGTPGSIRRPAGEGRPEAPPPRRAKSLVQLRTKRIGDGKVDSDRSGSVARKKAGPGGAGASQPAAAVAAPKQQPPSSSRADTRTSCTEGPKLVLPRMGPKAPKDLKGRTPEELRRDLAAAVAENLRVVENSKLKVGEAWWEVAGRKSRLKSKLESLSGVYVPYVSKEAPERRLSKVSSLPTLSPARSPGGAEVLLSIPGLHPRVSGWG